MFSAWRKLTGKQDEKPIFPSGVVPVGESMQKKYAKGVQYNMKIIIKGDRNTGKSALFHRLSGGGFKEEYIPTHEIQVADVNWNYQGAADVVKVEVWDIVDKGEKKKEPPGSLKIANDDEEVEEGPTTNGMALDAEFLNVYKGTHGVFLTMDITKQWTWTYVQRELEKIPHHIPVLVMGNFRDMGDRRVVEMDEIVAHVEHLDRPTGSAEVYFTESSMKDGFGLRFAYNYLNMPFLILQRETLLKQLEANTLEIEETRESLSIHALYEDQNYINFKELLSNNEKKTDDRTPDDTVAPPAAASTPNTDNPPENTITPADCPVGNLQPLPPLAKLEICGKSLPVATVSPTVHSAEAPRESILKSYTKKLFGGDGAARRKSNDNDDVGQGKQDNIRQDSGEIDFDTGQLPSGFLDNTNKSTKQKEKRESDDEVDGNPMVTGYADLDCEEEMKTFQEQQSYEAEFEDLSDDERPDLQQPAMSIIEQIKNERAANRTPDNLRKNDEYSDLDSDNDINDDVNMKELDLDDENFRLPAKNSITSDTSNGPPNMECGLTNNHPNMDIITASNIDIIDSTSLKSDPIYVSSLDTISNTNSHENIKNGEKGISDDDEDEEGQSVFVIACDIDVDVNDSWLVDEHSDDETITKGKTKEKPSTSSKCGSSGRKEPLNNNVKNSQLNFEVDELEMFMKSQLEPTSIDENGKSEAVVEAVIEVSDSTRSKRKKKKTTNSEEAVTSTEKRKKKKAINTEEGDEKTVETTKKTKKSKSSSTSTVDSKSSVPGAKTKKTKKTKKKEEDCEKSELDSFYEGL